jgi:UDP-glucose 4-epimerase
MSNNTIKNSIILITGGTGTFGQCFVKHCLDLGAAEVRVFSRDKKKQIEMMEKHKGRNISFFIGDICDKKSIVPAMKGVDHVFHAAAMKHIPLCEQFPIEAIKTNVIGSNNVFDLAI